MTAAAVLGAAVALTSGLHGVVTKGPTTPVCQAGTPCTAPAANQRLVFMRNGVAHRVTTDRLGRYRIVLPPGRYRARALNVLIPMRPAYVTVRSGLNLRINFSIDTGIR